MPSRSDENTSFSRPLRVLTVVIIASAAIFTCVVFFAAGYSIDTGEDVLTVHAVFARDVDVPYDTIDSVTLQDDPPAGGRINGYGSWTLSMGIYRNETFGVYQRYTHADCPEAVVIQCKDGRFIVLNGPTSEATQELFRTVSAAVDSPIAA